MSSAYQIDRCQTNNDVTTTKTGATYFVDVGLNPADTTHYDVALGLDMLDMKFTASDSDRVAQLDTDLFSRPSYKFQIMFDAKGSYILNNVGASFFKKTGYDTDFQFGISEGQGWKSRSGKKGFDRFVPFALPYDQPPKVFVALVGFYIRKHWRIKIYADDITVGGFNIHVETWCDGTSQDSRAGATVNWIAFPADKRDVAIGSFKGDASNRRPFDGYTSFDTIFSKPPSIFTAITEFDADSTKDLRVKMSTNNVTSSGMQWHIKTWSDTKLYSVAGAYLAFDT